MAHLFHLPNELLADIFKLVISPPNDTSTYPPTDCSWSLTCRKLHVIALFVWELKCRSAWEFLNLKVSTYEYNHA